MVSRAWSGCHLATVTGRPAADDPAADDPAADDPAADDSAAPLVRLRSVTANVPGVAATNVCRPAPRLSAPPGAHSRTCSGRYWLSSPSVPRTDVWYTRPSTVRAGPWPHAKLTDPAGVTARRPVSAGTDSCDNRSGSVSSWPVKLTIVAWRTRGKDTSIRSVVSCAANRTRPPAPMPASRVPSGLVIFTVSGVDGRPAAGRTISDPMLRLPCHRRWMTGLAVSAVHGARADPLIRLAGNPAGSAPGVEATKTSRTPGPGRAERDESEESNASSPAPGSASAVAWTPNAAGLATVKERAIGAVAAGSAAVNGDGTCWWNENATDGAEAPAGSDAGWSRRVTVTPGISTSEMPAPG